MGGLLSCSTTIGFLITSTRSNNCVDPFHGTITNPVQSHPATSSFPIKYAATTEPLRSLGLGESYCSGPGPVFPPAYQTGSRRVKKSRSLDSVHPRSRPLHVSPSPPLSPRRPPSSPISDRRPDRRSLRSSEVEASSMWFSSASRRDPRFFQGLLPLFGCVRALIGCWGNYLGILLAIRGDSAPNLSFLVLTSPKSVSSLVSLDLFVDTLQMRLILL